MFLKMRVKLGYQTLLMKMHLGCFNLLLGAMDIGLNAWSTAALHTALCIAVLQPLEA